MCSKVGVSGFGFSVRTPASVISRPQAHTIASLHGTRSAINSHYAFDMLCLVVDYLKSLMQLIVRYNVITCTHPFQGKKEKKRKKLLTIVFLRGNIQSTTLCVLCDAYPLFTGAQSKRGPATPQGVFLITRARLVYILYLVTHCNSHV